LAKDKKKKEQTPTTADYADFMSTLRFLWQEYILVDEGTLTDDARALREELLHAIHPTTHDAYVRGMREGTELYMAGFKLGLEHSHRELARNAAKENPTPRKRTTP